jgi:hypothetical protein
MDMAAPAIRKAEAEARAAGAAPGGKPGYPGTLLSD